MRGLHGFLVGTLALIALEVVSTNAQATGRVSGFFSGIVSATNWLLDNQTPGIPQRNAPTPLETPVAPSTTATQLLPAPAMAAAQPAYPTPGASVGSEIQGITGGNA